MSDYEPLSKSQQSEAELQEFLMIEKQKAQVQAQVHKTEHNLKAKEM